MTTFCDKLTELQVVADNVWFSQNGWHTLLVLVLNPGWLTSNSDYWTVELVFLYCCQCHWILSSNCIILACFDALFCFTDLFLDSSDGMPCPFMTRLSPSYIRNYGSSLLKTYGQHCPFMSRLTGTLTSANSCDEGKDE
jgi:hypothetical protein